MRPIQYFLLFRQAVSRLRGPNISFRWEAKFLYQLVESAQIICEKGHDKTISAIFEESLQASSIRRRTQFETLSETLALNMLAIRKVALYRDSLETFGPIIERLNKTEKKEYRTVIAELENDKVLVKLCQELKGIVKNLSIRIDLRNVTALVRMYYRHKSVLFIKER